MKVAVLGASANPARYSHRAVQRLRALGHEVFGVNPSLPDLGPVPVVASVRELPPGVHTLTVYVAPERCAGLEDELNAAGFPRVIFNPGSENPALAARLAASGTEVIEACTLVLLATGEFSRGVAPAPWSTDQVADSHGGLDNVSVQGEETLSRPPLARSAPGSVL